MPTSWGLGDDWERVVASLASIARIYDDVNRVISFSKDVSLRAEALQGMVGRGDRVLDAGAGNGVFSRIALTVEPSLGEIVLLDFSKEMLQQAKEKVDAACSSLVRGVYEHLPFRASCFEVVIMGFALRDAKDMEQAVTEVWRVMHGADGRFVVVDLGKPDNPVKAALVGFYWRIWAPLLAFLALGVRGLHVASIYLTYRRHPPNKEFVAKLREYFDDVSLKRRMLDGVILGAARGPTKREGM